MAENKENPESSFKVQDKRRFDMEGNERSVEEAAAESKKAGSLGDAAGSTASAKNSGSPQPDNLPEINFSSFVISLATQALMQLGQIKPPSGIEISVDRVAAKQTIDILNMLECKTKGNLDQDEQQLLDEVLHNLRLSFVKAV